VDIEWLLSRARIAPNQFLVLLFDEETRATIVTAPTNLPIRMTKDIAICIEQSALYVATLLRDEIHGLPVELVSPN
jgi:hypothetical protein